MSKRNLSQLLNRDNTEEYTQQHENNISSGSTTPSEENTHQDYQYSLGITSNNTRQPEDQTFDDGPPIKKIKPLSPSANNNIEQCAIATSIQEDNQQQTTNHAQSTSVLKGLFDSQDQITLSDDTHTSDSINDIPSSMPFSSNNVSSSNDNGESSSYLNNSGRKHLSSSPALSYDHNNRRRSTIRTTGNSTNNRREESYQYSTTLFPCNNPDALINPFDSDNDSEDIALKLALQYSLEQEQGQPQPITTSTATDNHSHHLPSSSSHLPSNTISAPLDEEIDFKNNSKQKIKDCSSGSSASNRFNSRKRSRNDREDLSLFEDHSDINYSSFSFNCTKQQLEINLFLNPMPIQSATEASGETVDHPALTSQNSSKKIQQVTGAAVVGSSTSSVEKQDQASVNNNKKTTLYSDKATYKHLACITPKNVGDNFNYQITIRLDEKSSYSCKSETGAKHCQFIISAKSDLKRLIELISDNTNLPITTVCFKKTLGDRQKIIPLSTKLPSILDKITVQKPLSLFINGEEMIELDFNNMYTEAGNDLFREKKFQEALEHYNTSIEHYPNDSRVMSNRALCLIKLTNFFEAFCDLTRVIDSDKSDSSNFFEKALHRRAHAAFELVADLKPTEEITTFINSLQSISPVKDEPLEVKLYYLCLKDMHKYLEKVGVIGADYATVMKKKEVELNDVKLIRAFHYLLHHSPKHLNYCLITKKVVSDLKLTTVFPTAIYSPENKPSQLYTPLPFCSREWYDSEMARYEELFSVKLWKPFYDNGENIHGKTMPSSDLYKFIIFTTFKYLLSKPDFNTLMNYDVNTKIFGKMLTFLTFGAGVPPKVYMYIENKSDETKIFMKEYTHQGLIEYIHIQVRDFHFIVEFKQPASSTFSSTDSSYGAKENRVKHGSDTFLVRVGDELPPEIIENK